MDVFEAVRTLLAVRSYEDRPVPEALVRRIAEAAHGSASSKNSQPWHFIVVQDRQTLRELGAISPTGAYIADASLGMVVAIDRTRSAVSDGSRAIQSMMLTAWAEGVGSNWVGVPNQDAVKSLLGIQDDVDVLAIVPFGYPAQQVGIGKKQRKPFGEVVNRERFGEPFE